MKKTLIISAIALSCSIATVSATSSIEDNSNFKIEAVNQVNSFCASIAKGDIETVKKLIDLGENVNRRSNGMTPAMYAAKYNRVEILELLIAKGANLKIRSDKSMTALKYAKQSNAKEAMTLIESTLSRKG